MIGRITPTLCTPRRREGLGRHARGREGLGRHVRGREGLGRHVRGRERLECHRVISVFYLYRHAAFHSGLNLRFHGFEHQLAKYSMLKFLSRIMFSYLTLIIE